LNPLRYALLSFLMAILLAGCSATTGSGGTTGAPPPVSGGLGANATGGLLAAPDPAVPPATAPARMEGRLLDGPYVPLLSKDDFERARRGALTAFESTPSGQTTIWRNPTNGHWGTLTPTRTYQDAGGRYCREYRQTVTLGGQEHQGNGSACREPDAIWHIMS
jgi:surface antigen